MSWNARWPNNALDYDAKNMNNTKLQKDPGCKVDCEYAQKGKPVASIGALPIFFGNVIYSFEAIGMVTSPMRHRKFYKATGAANGKYDD